MTSAAPSPTAPLARALLANAMAAFTVLPPERRGSSLAALDAFLAAPSPATFLAASRVLAESRRNRLLESAAAPALAQDFADGIAALRTLTSIPAELVDRLEADLPFDARTGRRLQALAALTRSYDELLSRVVADVEQMRKRFRHLAPRRPKRRE